MQSEKELYCNYQFLCNTARDREKKDPALNYHFDSDASRMAFRVPQLAREVEFSVDLRTK